MDQKAKHALRIVVGLYLVYLGWQLFDASVIKSSGHGLLGAVLGPVFIIVGLLYAISSIVKALAIRKKEQYGTEDTNEEDGTDSAEKEDKDDIVPIVQIADDNSSEIDSEAEGAASETEESTEENER